MHVPVNVTFGVIDDVVNVLLVEAVITGPSISENV
jgi:hypothetical protein